MTPNQRRNRVIKESLRRRQKRQREAAHKLALVRSGMPLPRILVSCRHFQLLFVLVDDGTVQSAERLLVGLLANVPPPPGPFTSSNNPQRRLATGNGGREC